MHLRGDHAQTKEIGAFTIPGEPDLLAQGLSGECQFTPHKGDAACWTEGKSLLAWARWR
jgi:hypothetical protein